MSKIINLEGQVLRNKLGLEFKVVEFMYRKNTEFYFKIKFLKTGNEKICNHRNIFKGSIKDEYNPSKYGVGYFGKGYSGKIYNGKAYKKWDSMLSRCYNPKNIQYHNYGAVGVTVCSRWLCFQNFVEDLPSLPGWDIELFEAGKLELDKDKIIYNNTVYGPYTCSLLSKLENLELSAFNNSISFKATHIDGRMEYHKSVNIFTTKYPELSSRTVLRRIHADNGALYKGWKFSPIYYIEII